MLRLSELADIFPGLNKKSDTLSSILQLVLMLAGIRTTSFTFLIFSFLILFQIFLFRYPSFSPLPLLQQSGINRHYHCAHRHKSRTQSRTEKNSPLI